MPQMTDQGRQIVAAQSARHGVSQDTVLQLMAALQRGGGTQAQFDISELGGMGQWLQGGMVMVGDMFNNGLKARVDALCSELAIAMQGTQIFAHDPEPTAQTASLTSTSWPAELGHPTSQGAQNDMRYAYFPDKQRLAVTQGGNLTVYDTAGHDIGYFGQSQGDSQSLSFTSQHGTIPLSQLAIITPRATDTAPPSDAAPDSDDQIFSRLQRLSELRDQGVVTEAEFSAKKAELLGRL